VVVSYKLLDRRCKKKIDKELTATAYSGEEEEENIEI